METVRILDYVRSAPLIRHLSAEKLGWIHAHAEEVNLESGVVSTCQGGPADGFEAWLPVDDPGSQEPLASRNLRGETST